MARRNYSRLAKTESRKAARSTAFYAVLTIGILFLFFTIGLPALGKLATYVSSLNEDGVASTNADGPPPAPPQFDTPSEYTNSKKIVVSGNTIAGLTVSVHLNDEVNEVLAGSDGKFSTTFELKDGTNSLYAVAKNNSGQVSTETKTYTINFDNEPPEVKVIAPEDNSSFFGTQNQTQKIQGETEPEASVMINDRVAIVRSDGKFDYPVTLNEGTNEFHIVSSDKAGNTSELNFKLNFSK